jgi:hypothetical protein
MINEFLTLTKDWHPFFSFFIVALAISIIGFAIVSIIYETSKFIGHTLPILVRGWPNNSTTPVGEVSGEEENSPEDKK